MRRTFPVVALLAIVFPACAALTRPASLAQFEHELSYGTDIDAYDLEVPLSGASFATGDVDKVRYPQLARAWTAGEAPPSPLIGRDHAIWLRQLDVTPMLGTDGQVNLEAKAMAPYPVRLTILAIEDDREVALTQGSSEPWSAATHFAKLNVDYLAGSGTVIIVRMEGAHQAHETHVRLVAASEWEIASDPELSQEQ
ncbi:MAG: hypothetical protein QF489_04350 [Planctomycetota bacterium]|jgi:hypothetical protein|nr:hypothetical protein [Planctomycetota bacterium]